MFWRLASGLFWPGSCCSRTLYYLQVIDVCCLILDMMKLLRVKSNPGVGDVLHFAGDGLEYCGRFHKSCRYFLDGGLMSLQWYSLLLLVNMFDLAWIYLFSLLGWSFLVR